MNQLQKLVAAARAEVARRRVQVPPDVLERAVARRREVDDRRSFAAALNRPGLSLIAEHKRSSPSAGPIREGLPLEHVIRSYERGGAAALSVLTEPTRFGGSLEDLRCARASSSLPILRKDFIVEPYQLQESFAHGADAVLLIVAALSERGLRECQQVAADLGLATLVEVHDERELDRAASAGAELIGINNRDLTTLEVDVRRTFGLLARVPAGATVVAESGFSRREQLDELAEAGVDAVLIGEALMRAPDIEAVCRMLTGSAVL